jgi:hypothetical protein
VLHPTIDLEPPVLLGRTRVSKAAEWNADLDLESSFEQVAARLPNEVGAQIVLPWHDVRPGDEPAVLALRTVGLNAERVDDEHQRAVSFVEGVEMDLDVIVSADAVAIGESRRDGAVWFEGANAEIDRGRRVPNSDLGRVRCRSLIYGLVE